MAAFTKRDRQGGNSLTILALELQGPVTEEYSQLLRESCENLNRRYKIETEMDAACKPAARKLRSELRRMLGRDAWGVSGYAADVRAIVNHAERPEIYQAAFDVGFWMKTDTHRLKTPHVSLRGLLIRGPETMVQFRALSEAARRYREVLAEGLAELASQKAVQP